MVTILTGRARSWGLRSQSWLERYILVGSGIPRVYDMEKDGSGGTKGRVKDDSGARIECLGSYLRDSVNRP